MDKIKILIADNQTLIREAIRRVLETEEDIKVVAEAGSDEETVKLTGIHKPDIVVIDIGWPKMDAAGITRQIKVSFPDTGVMLLTAHENDEYIYSLLEAGADGYILKSSHSRDLINGIHSLFAGVAVLDPWIARKVLNHFVPAQGQNKGQPAQSIISSRELEVLQAAVDGLDNPEIASVLKISGRTLQVHWSHIYNKLQVNSRSQAIVRALKDGSVSLEQNKTP